VDSSQLQVSIELLGLPSLWFSRRSLYSPVSSIKKCNLLKARVIIYAYHHVRLLPPEPLVVKQPKCTQVEEADTVMQSSETLGAIFCRTQPLEEGFSSGFPFPQDNPFSLRALATFKNRETGTHSKADPKTRPLIDRNPNFSKMLE
jgi:hypothetical protein